MSPSSSTSRRIRRFLPVLAILAGNALAHDPRPVVVSIAEQFPEVYVLSLRVPETVEAANMPRLVWPDHCETLPALTGTNLQTMRCPGGLSGTVLQLAYPDFNPSLATYFDLQERDGVRRTAMLPPTEDQWLVPERPGGAAVALRYLVIGGEHILGGPDHLLFVLGLLVIAGTVRRILWTITGFTLAHSITLSLSALGLVSVPVVPVEAGIALSILFLAVEIGRENHDTVTYRYPLIVAFIFGLLHGLGFASALGEVGLAQGEIVLSLLFFNLGVEIGQVGFIALVLIVLALLRQVPASGWARTLHLLALRQEHVIMYVVGIPAAYWLIDRLSFLY